MEFVSLTGPLQNVNINSKQEKKNLKLRDYIQPQSARRMNSFGFNCMDLNSERTCSQMVGVSLKYYMCDSHIG